MSNNFYGTILALGGFFGALTIMFTFLYKFKFLKKYFLLIRSWLLEPSQSEITFIKEAIEKLREELRELDDKMLKHIVCDPNTPTTERLVAGEIYTQERHLNGEVKAIYEALKYCYEKKLKEEIIKNEKMEEETQ